MDHAGSFRRLDDGGTSGVMYRHEEGTVHCRVSQDAPPDVRTADLTLERPEIYYGEVTQDYVFVRTTQEEFNYPEGDKNIFSTYEGAGGIELASLIRIDESDISGQVNKATFNRRV